MSRSAIASPRAPRGADPPDSVQAIPSVLYHLMPAGQAWTIAFEGRSYGHRTLAAATIAAVKAARSSAEKGHSAQVLMQRRDGAWGLLWDSATCQPPPRPSAARNAAAPSDY